jgi:enoyl-CoA hydratase
VSVEDSEAGDEVLVRRAGPVAVVTLNRPAARNAIDVATARLLEAAVIALETDDSVAAWVLEGAPNPSHVFCAGADLKDLAAGRFAEIAGPLGLAGFTHRRRSKPAIAAVDVFATAGGCELVLACDLVVASTRGAFGLAEVKRNLLASGGGAYRLPRALGTRVALEAMLTGEPVEAARAYQLGLVNRLVKPGTTTDAALRIAQLIVRNGPLAIRAAMRIAHLAFDLGDAELDAVARAETTWLRASHDTAEALQAFVEHRPPRWTGR